MSASVEVGARTIEHGRVDRQPLEGRATAEIDLASIQRNCLSMRSRLGPHTAFCAVVKADGYGHGAAEAARAAVAGGAGMLAVATATEAAELRSQLPGERILVLGPLSPDELSLALDAGAEVTAWERSFLTLAADQARSNGRVAGIHLKFDSGMGRLGTREGSELRAMAHLAAEKPSLHLLGVATHLATADTPESGFAEEQIARFRLAAGPIKAEFPGVALHAANSAATIARPAAHFDMVRCGVALYGLDPFQRDPANHGLEPALRLVSYVAARKTLEPGASAGYGQAWCADKQTSLAIVPIGYGDGLPRALSNRGEVLIGGHRYPIVGRVSMDSLAVDLGSRSPVEQGQRVTLLGADGAEQILAEEWAAMVDTINYEIASGLGPRVIRRYRAAEELA